MRKFFNDSVVTCNDENETDENLAKFNNTCVNFSWCAPAMKIKLAENFMDENLIYTDEKMLIYIMYLH